MAVATRVEPITVNELYAQLVSFEKRMEARGRGQQSSMNIASKEGCGGGNYNNNVRGGGHGGRHGGHSYKGGHSGRRFEHILLGQQGVSVLACSNYYSLGRRQVDPEVC